MTQNCPHCGAEIPKPVNVCTNCGKKIRDDRKSRDNPSRVEGCLSIVLLSVVNIVLLTYFVTRTL